MYQTNFGINLGRVANLLKRLVNESRIEDCLDPLYPSADYWHSQDLPNMLEMIIAINKLSGMPDGKLTINDEEISVHDAWRFSHNRIKSSFEPQREEVYEDDRPFEELLVSGEYDLSVRAFNAVARWLYQHGSDPAEITAGQFASIDPRVWRDVRNCGEKTSQEIFSLQKKIREEIKNDKAE